ncbi:hypothetical protein [Clostridium gasigenes]|nr:hypothetical protein [Clostridium gasigenes]
MNFKKYIGAMLLMLSGRMIKVGAASMLALGTEDMPDSIKNLR